jgi:hypothetical protein
MARIFLSYRRDDSPYAVAGIKAKLGALLGSESIFFDVDSIPIGADFRQHLNDEVAKCNVLMAIMGAQWLQVQHNNVRRLDDPGDFVRIEIESALERGIPVVPVLLDNIEMPQADELPDSLRNLAYRQAVVVRAGQDLDHDLDHLAKEIQKIIGEYKPIKESESKNSNNKILSKYLNIFVPSGIILIPTAFFMQIVNISSLHADKSDSSVEFAFILFAIFAVFLITISFLKTLYHHNYTYTVYDRIFSNKLNEKGIFWSSLLMLIIISILFVLYYSHISLFPNQQMGTPPSFRDSAR